MAEMGSAMTAVLATWAIWAAVLLGIGNLVARLGGAHALARTPLSVRFWLGWATVVAALQLWHLALPVDDAAACAVIALGTLGLALNARTGPQRFRDFAAQVRSSRPQAALVAVGLLVAIVWSNLSLGIPHDYDTGLYHLQAVRWNGKYPLVPGLGNLHGRLAFNNSSFLYAALLDAGPWKQRSHHLANGLLSLAVLLTLLARLPRWQASGDMGLGIRGWRRKACWSAPRLSSHAARSGPSFADRLSVLLLPPTILASYKHTTSYSPDLVVFLLGVVLATWLAELAVRKEPLARHCASLATNPNSQPRELVNHTVLTAAVVLLSFVGVTVKVSFLAFALVAVIVAFRLAWRPCSDSMAGTRRQAAFAALAIASVVIVPWTVRSVVLSGYLVYPCTLIAFDVPWRVPAERAEQDAADIRKWARYHAVDEGSATDASGAWLGTWLKRQARDVLRVILPLIGCVLGLLIARQRNLLAPRWLVAWPAVASAAFVLAIAPDLSRFAGASLWILASVALATALEDLRQPGPNTARVHAQRFAFAAWCALMIVAGVKTARYTTGPTQGGFAPLPIADLVTRPTDSGLPLHVPRGMVQPDGNPGRDQAWDAPLPSTPYLRPNLATFRPDDLRGGFVELDPAAALPTPGRPDRIAGR